MANQLGNISKEEKLVIITAIEKIKDKSSAFFKMTIDNFPSQIEALKNKILSLEAEKDLISHQSDLNDLLDKVSISKIESPRSLEQVEEIIDDISKEIEQLTSSYNQIVNLLKKTDESSTTPIESTEEPIPSEPAQ